MAELTIAFVDLTGSVSVFETLGNDRAAKAVTKLTQWIGTVGLEHGGTVVKMLGDGVLLSFSNNRLAVECMSQIQQDHAARAALWPMGLTLVAISLATPLVSQTVFEKWFTLPELFALLPIPLACGAAFFSAYLALHRPRIVEAGYGWIVFAATVLIFLLAFLGLAYSIYPYVVLDQLTIWDAASSTEALAVILIGVAITLPVIIIYTIFMYRVFWGKATTLSYGMTPKD